MKPRRPQGIPVSLAQVILPILLLLLSGCSDNDNAADAERQQFLAHRESTLADFEACARQADTPLAALVAESRCNTVSLPENYAEPQARQIDLKVMVLPSLADMPLSDPLFLMAGGPGQAATDLIQVAQVFSRLRTERDIVLVDQRGTGELSPFDCQLDDVESDALAEQDPDFDEMLAIQLAVITVCLAEMDADPRYYTTDIAMQDLDAIRQWLEFPQINLWGASYGSRAALAYLQAFLDSTRAVIIDAIASTTLTLPLYSDRDASASLEKLLADCAAQVDCQAAFPNLSAHFDERLDRLATPQPVTVIDDRDFSTIETTFSDYEFLSFIRQVLYSREAQRVIPLIIEQAWLSNYRPLQALAGQYGETDINQGMFLSVICNEDFSRLDQGQLSA